MGDSATIKTRSVLFVEVTRGGLLAKRLREIELKLRKITGYKTKIVEGVGRKMKDILSNTDPWRGQPCGRNNCPVCLQAGEEKISCRRRNLIYESRCLKCNPKEEEKKENSSLEDKRQSPSIYVGETARSLAERVLEHWRDLKDKEDDSHMLNHWLEHHEEDAEPPEFEFKIVKFCRDALSRQVGGSSVNIPEKEHPQ